MAALDEHQLRASRLFMTMGLVRRALGGAFWPLFLLRLVTEVELEPLQLVLLGTVFELSILTFEIPTGVVADIYSRKWSVIISFFVVAAAVVTAGVAETYWLLVISQILMGFGYTFESGAETAWMTAEVGSTKAAEPLILKRASWQLLTGVIGIGVFAGLAAGTSLTTALVVIGIGYAMVGIYLVAAMPENNFSRTSSEGWDGFIEMLSDGWGQCRKIPPLRILLTVIFIFGLAKEVVDRLDIQRLVDVGLPDDLDEVLVVGALVASRSVFAAAALWVARRKAGGSQVVPALAMLLFGIAAGITFLAHSELLLVAGLGMILQGGFSLATQPLVVNWTNAFASSDARATVHSFIGQGEAFGEILGGIVLGTVAQLTSVPTAMTISAVLMVAAGLLALTARSAWADSGV